MPPKLAEIVDEFASAPREVVLEMLLEFSDAVPPLPAELAGHEGMEQVPECQTQFFLEADRAARRHRADVVRLPAGGADHPRLRRHPGRGPGRRERRRRSWPCRTTSTPGWGWRRRSARCGSAAARPSWAGSSARSASRSADRREQAGSCRRCLRRSWISRSGPTSSARGATSASVDSKRRWQGFDGDVNVTFRAYQLDPSPVPRAAAAQGGAGRQVRRPGARRADVRPRHRGRPPATA